MNSKELIQTLQEFKEQKSIDRETMKDILETVFRTVLQKEYGTDDNFDVIINLEKGDFEIWRIREVVEDGEVTDANREISLSEAKAILPDYEVGEEVSDEVRFEDFARRNILAIRQNLTNRITDFERDNLFARYSDRIGELIAAEVYQVRKREVILLDDEGHELIMPKMEQIPNDFFRKGDTIRAVILKVEMGNAGPLVILSRTASRFLECLMEQEVPEILDGLITIKKVVRIPGERAKVAVESYDDRIDPVGSCVGQRGSRIHSIVKELRNENIDVIAYTTNTQLYITRALNPARITSVEIDEENHYAQVYLDPDQVSVAIGKNGCNIRLASQLTGFRIDVFRDKEVGSIEEDFPLEDFADEIPGWVIAEFKEVGLETAQSILELPRDALAEKTDLEVETIDEVLQILLREFDQPE